jgi:hypothetical protein
MHNGRHILREFADIEEYSHGPNNTKGIENKELVVSRNNPYEGQREQRTELDIEIDGLWKLIIKNSIWEYHERKRTVSHKL